ncbi:glycosyltransferase family 4 protein [Sphingomonas sp. PR090111-T3T-6A]|uniref:glycosyltransferase family 4 protein n=1 Tax=Sphingomonas sp. PR090111-T3T-6A TaxID=685778 RepID=UPI000363143E|nr:glycosyltransferase family 1 protein [Sphingomonas sp. PR090111-T3T-6A]
MTTAWRDPRDTRTRPPLADQPEILLDISRLVSRVLHKTPTGVDRVELAYAEGLLREAPERLSFCLVHPTGFYGRIPTKTARAFLEATRAAWAGEIEIPASGPGRKLHALKVLWQMRPRRARPGGSARRVLVQSSPHHLHNEQLVRDILRREQARLVCLIHDLIPIEYPEYARPGGDALHRRRIRTVARLASAALGNSAATLRSFAPHLAAERRDIPLRVAHLGLHDESRPVPRPTAQPYFACLGTIEARKNHLLLLNIWRQWAEEAGDRPIPKLVIIGRRGWENEQVVDMLDRCPALKGHVEEMSALSDADMRGIVAGACAVLLPSFAEGFGMPVTEALALGTPVICSDLPALREAGSDAADYIHPLDGIGWHNALIEYSAPGSGRRAAQLARMQAWAAPSWEEHVRIVLKTVEEIA